MLKLSLIGGLLVGITVVIHALGTAWWVRHLNRRFVSLQGPLRVFPIVRALVTSALVILMLHLVEVALWAAVYLMALPTEATWSVEQALYFSLVTFTTLGYGEITLGPDLRLLSGIEALNGILLVGWSTALLFAVLQRVWRTGLKNSPPSKL